MKVFTLALTTLCVAVLAHASVDYHLKCAPEELGIRWPSYHSHSEYYVCQRLGGKQVKMYCEPGQIFTFVLQTCTSPDKYIPAPPMDILPTASPFFGVDVYEPVHQGQFLPQPLYPNGEPVAPIVGPGQPPLIIDEQPPHHWELPIHKPDHEKPVVPVPEVVKDGEEDEHSEEVNAPNRPPHIPAKPEIPEGPSQPTPPTPAPTPPVVASNKPSPKPNQKPQSPSKPKPNQKPTAGVKPGQKPANDAKKPTPNKKPLVPQPPQKKQPPVPAKPQKKQPPVPAKGN